MNLRFPVKLPVAVGSHLIPTIQVAPPGNLPGQVSDTLTNGNGDTVSLRLPMLFPVFVAETIAVGLIVPTATVPKATVVGLNSSGPPGDAFCARARSGAARAIAMRSAKLKLENVKVNNFGRLMMNPPMSSAVTNILEKAPRLP